ncbi:hypothetical protein KC207_15395 [Phycicoccus sp. BSK3Z-2]|uniref:Uncharacterized protein n=1 Tax=Phycicoccus avicenniae TaxID=2828860 RepID=A0A941I1U9_9MICO|nr:hypothetical protein [Phycicoccus avicenniae]MBR7744681.1 hypothetical protein [Phycicoccus avicenniae]
MSLVPTGATVGVVGGRWVGDLAPALLGVRPTVVVTTSTVLAGRLDDEVPVVLPPGRHDGRGEVVGRSVAECLDALRLDVVLVGACGTTPAGVRLSGRPGLASSLVRSAAPGGVVVLEPGSSDRGTDEGEVLDAGAVDVLVVGRHDVGRVSPGMRRRVGRVVLAG